MEDVFAAVDARPKRRQGVTGQTIEAQMRGTMCQITEYELEMLRDEITRLKDESAFLKDLMGQRTITIRKLEAERDQALAASAAREIAMRDRAADAMEDYCSDAPDLAGHGHSTFMKDVIFALPLSPDGQQALADERAKAWEAGWLHATKGGLGPNPYRKESDK